jgi:hypothetical protein
MYRRILMRNAEREREREREIRAVHVSGFYREAVKMGS